MKKILAYFFGGIACLGVGAGVYIAAGVYYRPPAPVVPFAARMTTAEAINELVPLVGKTLNKNVEATVVTLAPSPVIKPTTVFFAGDIMLGRDVALAISKNGSDYPFAKIKDEVASSDYAVANLEGPLTATNNAPGNNMRFHFDPALTSQLSSAGFDAFSLANNHGLDQGAQGFDDTKNNLSAAGLKYFGDAADDNGQVLHFTLSGNNFAVIGAQDVYRQIDPTAIGKEIATEKAAGYFVIIYPHWGVEYSHQASTRQVTLAHAFIDAGADLVIGSHPHVIEGIEAYKGKTIFYSLGNLIFDQYFSTGTQQGLALRLNVDAQKNVSIDLLPFEIPRSQPSFVDGDKKTKMLQDIASWSAPELKDQIVSGSIKPRE